MLDPGAQVFEVLLGHRRKFVGRARDVEPLARGDYAAELDLAVELPGVGPGLEDAQAHRAVGEVDGLAGLDGGGEPVPADRHASRVAETGVGVGDERDGVAAAQQDLVVVEESDANLRPRQVLEDRHGAPGAAGRLPDHRRGLSVRLVRPVAEVQASHVHPGVDHPHERLGIARSRADRGDDLGAAFHRR